MQTSAPSPVYTVISGPAWTVASSSATGLVYTVTTDPRTGLYVCGCNDHQYRQRDCKHIYLERNRHARTHRQRDHQS